MARREGIGRRLSRVGCVLELVLGVLGSGKDRTIDGLQSLERCPLPALLIAARKLERSLEGILVLGYEARLEVVGIVRHRGENREAEEQKQRGEGDAYEECGEVAEIAQEDAQAEARDEAHALR